MEDKPQQQAQHSKIKCLVSSRLPSEYSASGHECKIRLLLYSTKDIAKDPEQEQEPQILPELTHFTESGTNDFSGGKRSHSSTVLSASDFHLAMVFGDHYLSKDLEKVRDVDNAYLLNKRGATRWKNDVNYSHLWDGSQDANANAMEQKQQHVLQDQEPPLVRIHSSCFTGETLGSLRCDCAEQLHTSISLMTAAGTGILLYLNQEGRGIGLLDKLFAYNLIDTGRYDTFSANLALGHGADEREYSVAALMLRDLGVNACRLLTNNPDKMNQLSKHGIHVVDRLSLIPQSWTLDEQDAVVNVEKEESSTVDDDTLLPLDALQMKKDNFSESSSTDTSNSSTAPTVAASSSALLQSPKQGQSLMPKKSKHTRPVQDRDGYLLTKIKRMGHQLSVPAFLENLLTPSSVVPPNQPRE